MHAPGDLLVGQVVLVAELVAHVVVERRRVGPDDRVVRRVGVHLLGDRAGGRPGEAAVEPADGAPLVAQQLAEEAPVLDAQVGPVDVVLGQPGQRRRAASTACARSLAVSRSPRDSTHG